MDQNAASVNQWLTCKNLADPRTVPTPILGLDIGSTNTRAMLFEAGEHGYYLAGSGSAPTTSGGPFFNLRAGLRIALEELQAVTGRSLLDVDKSLVHPLRKDGSGVAGAGAVFSTPMPTRIVWVAMDGDGNPGILLAALGAVHVEPTGVNDRRKPEVILDAVLGLRPHLILATGHPRTQPSAACLAALEPIRMAYYLLPEEQRPLLIFSCDPSWKPRLRSIFGASAEMVMLGEEASGLAADFTKSVQGSLSNALIRIYRRQFKGLASVWDWTKGNLLTAQAGFSSSIQYLSQGVASAKPVFGADLGAGALKFAAACQGELLVGAYPGPAAPGGSPGQPTNIQPEDLRRWLALPEISDWTLHEYLANRSIYPSSVPVMVDELAIEEAYLRSQVQAALGQFASVLPGGWPAGAAGGLYGFEPILVAGSAISATPSLAHACLTLLDSLQPQGITTLMIDRHNLAGVLGVLRASQPQLVQQMVEAGCFVHLCTVISPAGNASAGTPVLQAELLQPDKAPVKLTVKQGSLETLPLPPGQTARLLLQPFQRLDLGMGGAGRGGELRVTGSALGVVIDCRGRPLRLHADLARRHELYKKWIWTIGG